MDELLAPSLFVEPALVDWCEPNYVASAAVAEWWNTVSSLAMAAVGLLGAWRVRGGEVRFVVGMVGLAGIGLGSAAFHGTLLRVAQAADELPMVWLGLACVWALAQRDRPSGAGKPLAVALAAFGLVFCVAYATVPWAFGLFLAVYASMVAWLAVRTVWLSWGVPSPPVIRRTAATVIGGYLGGFFLFWVPEHVLFGCDAPLQALQLHAWWHVGAAIGTAAWWQWAALDRRRALGALAAGEAAGATA